MQIKSPTIADVAKQADVSTATVSRCLNQPEIVKAEVRERISKAIQELAYVPSGAARSLASRRTHTIGAIVPTIDNAIFSEAIQHLQSGLTQANYTLLLANSGYSLDEELREVNTLLSRGIDGIVLVGEMHHPKVYAAIEQRAIPYVNLWTYNPTSKYSCIGFDHIKAGKQLAKHLLELGHTKFGIISGFQETNDRALLRFKGIQKTLKSAGLEIPENRIIECRYSVGKANASLHELLDREPEITAICCGNDVLAIGALSATRERGIKVPEQLSITGFDNMEIIPYLSPALTTVNSPSKRMGKKAADYILRQIENKKNGKTVNIDRIELKAELIIRDTTGPAPKR